VFPPGILSSQARQGLSELRVYSEEDRYQRLRSWEDSGAFDLSSRHCGVAMDKPGLTLRGYSILHGGLNQHSLSALLFKEDS
jgi:hypothetical protein